MNNITFTTREVYIKDDPTFSPTQGSPGGGVTTKVININNAAPYLRITSDFDNLGKVALIEPLAMHTPSWPDNIGALKSIGSIKIIWAEEQELIRWPGQKIRQLSECVDKVVVCNEYLHQIVSPMEIGGIPTGILYTPINEEIFKPTPKKRQIICVGKVGLQKNIDGVIRFFQALPPDIHKVYIGDAGMWGDIQYPVDIHMQDRLNLVCDEYIESLPYSKVAEKVSESMYYLNMSIYDVGCLAFLEAAMAGCHCFCWDYHPMFDEYKNIYRFKTVPEGVETLLKVNKAISGNGVNREIRKEMMKKHSYKAFDSQLKSIVQEVMFYEA